MSTDDLTARATEGVCTHQNAQYLAMKGERDALRAERLELIASRAEFQRAVDRRTAERDVAQAVVDRVTDLVLNTPHAWVTVRELTHILRGQP